MCLYTYRLLPVLVCGVVCQGMGLAHFSVSLGAKGYDVFVHVQTIADPGMGLILSRDGHHFHILVWLGAMG
jgi:hypothetical protein